MRLFICSADQDQSNVLSLTNALDAAGHESWLDLWLLSDTGWQEQVQTAIRQSRAVLHVLTSYSARDERCRWERQQAVHSGKPVIVIRFDPEIAVPEDLGSSATIIDFNPTPTAQNFGRLMDLLKDAETAQPGAPSWPNHRQPPARGLLGAAERHTFAIATAAVVGLLGLLADFAIKAQLSGEALEATPGVFHAIYRLGPIGLFVIALGLFTVIRQPRISASLFILFQAILFSSYLATPEATLGGYILAVMFSLLGYFVGKSRLVLWPWVSYRLWRQYSRLKRDLAADAPVDEAAAGVLTELDKEIAAPLYGYEAVLHTLAEAGLSLHSFNARTASAAHQMDYRIIVQSIGIRRLETAADLQDVYDIVERYDLVSYENRASLRIFIQKLAHSATAIERLRTRAQFLWQLGEIIQPDWEEQQSRWPRQHIAIQVMIQQIYASVNLNYSDVAQYWLAYRNLEATVEQINAIAERHVETGECARQGVHLTLQQLSQTQQRIREIETEFSHLPEYEKGWHHALLDTDFDATQLLTVDYRVREEMVRAEIERLQLLGRSQPASWLAISNTGEEVVDQMNPWCVMTHQLMQRLEMVRQMDDRYVAWAETELSSILAGLRTVKDIADLDQRLSVLTMSDDSFGPMVDGTIEALQEIGQQTRAALASMEGTHHRRQLLIEAEDRSNALRNWLRTRYGRARTRQWADYVQKSISEVLDDHLNHQREQEQATYRNPYIVGNPITPKSATLFKGRTDLARQLADFLNRDNQPTIVLYGPRRMGKTSFLLQLQNLLRGLNDDYIPVFLNGQDVGVCQNDASFFYFLARAIHTQLTQRTGQQIERPTREDLESEPYSIIREWIDDKVAPLLNERQMLLITIDEFEKIGEAIHKGELSEKILDFLRHTMQHGEHMVFLFCGVETLDALGPNAASYFISVQTFEISYLSQDAAEELIRSPNPAAGQMPDYDDDVVAEIIRLTHCQPYLVQAICSRIVDIANEEHLRCVQMDTLEKGLSSLFDTNRLYFQYLWNDAGEYGRTILTTLAGGPASLEPGQLAHPEGKGLLLRRVICRRPDGMHEIEIPLMQHWVALQTEEGEDTLPVLVHP